MEEDESNILIQSKFDFNNLYYFKNINIIIETTKSILFIYN